MPVKVELHPDVWDWLKTCHPPERDEFVTRLEHVRREPIGNSELHIEPSLSRFVLRRFGFGHQTIAIFEYNAALSRIRVLKCRRLRPGESSGRQKPGGGGMSRGP